MFRKDEVIRVMKPKVLRALLTMLFIYGTNVNLVSKKTPKSLIYLLAKFKKRKNSCFR